MGFHWDGMRYNNQKNKSNLHLHVINQLDVIVGCVGKWERPSEFWLIYDYLWDETLTRWCPIVDWTN